MSSLVGGLPAGTVIEQNLQITQIVHAQAMEVAPAGDAEQVVDDYGSVTFTGQALVAGQLFGGFFGFVTVFVGVEEFHGLLDAKGAGRGLCPSRCSFEQKKESVDMSKKSYAGALDFVPANTACEIARYLTTHLHST